MSDSYYILALADTHAASLKQLPSSISELIKAADCVVHCGDFTGMNILDEIRFRSKQFIGVYGNTDGADIRKQLPAEATFQIEGKKIAVTHPHFGGSPWGLEDFLSARYPDADAVIFGHTHDPCSINRGGRLLFNPGQGYPVFTLPASVGILKVTADGIDGRFFSPDDAVFF